MIRFRPFQPFDPKKFPKLINRNEKAATMHKNEAV